MTCAVVVFEIHQIRHGNTQQRYLCAGLFSTGHEKLTDKLSVRQQSIYCVKNARNALSRKHCRGDYKTANSKLLEIDWNVMDDMNVEQCWNYFSENVKTVINDTIPIHKDPKKKPKPP